MKRTLALLALAACGTPPTTLDIVSASPSFAPMIGGTTTRLTGTGFLDGDAGGNRVLIASREAPLARVIDDTTLEVVLPPGDQPGDAEVVVLNDHGNARATGILRYSAPPAIESVEPANIVFTSTETLVTVTGSGFVDEGAGTVNVVVDGVLASFVTVVSDTSLTFVAPPGLALVRPDIEVVDVRGSATRPRAFRYTPSDRDGLLLFMAFGVDFALFYDPSDHSTISIPRTDSPAQFSAIVRDDSGDYWGSDRSRRFGRIDMRTQRIATPSQLTAWLPAITRVGDRYLGISRNLQRLGELDPQTGAFNPIGTHQIPCCSSYGLAFDGATLYYTSRSFTAPALTPIDPDTGVAGTPIPIVMTGSLHVGDMRFFKGVLYIANRDGALSTIDPATGILTELPISGPFSAIEPFEP